MSWQLTALDLWLRWVEKPYLARETDFVRARSRLEHLSRRLPPPAGARITAEPLGPLGSARVAGPPGATAPVLLWLHGGAYCLGSPRTHAAMVAHLARRIGAAAVLPDYRLAPEHPFPAALEDAIAGYRALLAEGVAPRRIILGGDSAGGGLAFALIAALAAAGLPAPACVIAFSPWVDLTLSGQSLRDLAEREALLPAARVAEIRDLYLAGADPADPRASPIFAQFAGAPPVLIQASAAEILRDDALRLAARLRHHGVDARADIWPEVPHVWQLYPGQLPEADQALDQAAAFAKAHLAGG